MVKRPGGALMQSSEPTRSQLVPVLTKWREVRTKGQLGPMLFCIGTFFSLMLFGSDDVITIPIRLDATHWIDPRQWVYTSNVLIIVASFLTLWSLFFIYRLVGKQKSWWVLLASLGFSAYFLWLFKIDHDFGWLYDFFHGDLAGGEVTDTMSIPQVFVRHLLGTGPFEELVKAVPVLVLAALAARMAPDIRAKYGVEEPLDGILIGAASGCGFAIAETLLQYTPGELVTAWLQKCLEFAKVPPGQMAATIEKLSGNDLLMLIRQGADILGTSVGLKSVIFRSIDLAFGHMAYSGYFGYFIGLAVLKPQHKWRILLIGYASAIVPHAIWDTIPEDQILLTGICAVLAYTLLAAAVLKAREISPNRMLLQPSVTFGIGAPVPAYAGAAAASQAPAAAPYTPQPVYPSPSTAAVGGNTGGAPVASRIRIGSTEVMVAAGIRLMDYQVPGLTPQAPGGLVAEVTRNPNDPAVLGLTNVSTAVWQITSPGGGRREIATGQTVRLAPGTRIDFGRVQAEVS